MDKWNYYANRGHYENIKVINEKQDIAIYSYFDMLNWQPDYSIVYKDVIVHSGALEECETYMEAILKIKEIDSNREE